MLLALWVLPGVFGSPGIVWHFWLCGYCLALLPLQILSGAFGSQDISGTFGYLGIVWLSGYHPGHYLIKMILSKNIFI